MNNNVVNVNPVINVHVRAAGGAAQGGDFNARLDQAMRARQEARADAAADARADAAADARADANAGQAAIREEAGRVAGQMLDEQRQVGEDVATQLRADCAAELRRKDEELAKQTRAVAKLLSRNLVQAVHGTYQRPEYNSTMVVSAAAVNIRGDGFNEAWSAPTPLNALSFATSHGGATGVFVFEAPNRLYETCVQNNKRFTWTRVGAIDLAAVQNRL